MSSSPEVPVTLAEIARLAGVGRAAVSNWRRRHPDFPERIGGTDVRPEFGMAQIEAWLRDNEKMKPGMEREWLWPSIEALGDRDETGRLIAEIGRVLAGRESPAAVGDAADHLIHRAVELGRQDGERETFEFLVRRWLDVHVRQITTTPEPLAALIAELASLTAAARPGPSSGGLVALDPACGTGHLLAAATDVGATALVGGDLDPVLVSLAEARLGLLTRVDGGSTERPRTIVDVRCTDSLRSDAFAEESVDIVLCNPPFNERDWGYEELATDGRWVHGLPPRTEPELAWVQHCLSRLRPGGCAVLLLPPAVASRRAGRRIRGSLLRTGQLRAVVALPPGSAPPHSVSLHLWVLRVPDAQEQTALGNTALLVDAASRFPRRSPTGPSPDWTELQAFLCSAFKAWEGTVNDAMPTSLPDYAAAVPVIDLLDDEVDLTPARHVRPPAAEQGRRLTETWEEFGRQVTALSVTGGRLAALDLDPEAADAQSATTVGELSRAGALVLGAGQHPTEGSVVELSLDGTAVPLLTIPDLHLGHEPRSWVTAEGLTECGAAVAEAGDVVVVGVARVFDAWVHEGPPTALGPQLYAVRIQPEQLDAWFLASMLRAPANARQAGTHSSSSSRVDVRRLQVRQLPLAGQRRYGAAFRELVAFEDLLRRTGSLGRGLVGAVNDELAAGALRGPV